MPTPYDPDAWRAASVLIEKYGSAPAIVLAQEVSAAMARQESSSAHFWRLIAGVVEDWHRPVPREDESFQ